MEEATETRTRAEVGAGMGIGVGAGVKAQEVDTKELLLSIGALEGPPANLLLPKLIGKGF